MVLGWLCYPRAMPPPFESKTSSSVDHALCLNLARRVLLVLAWKEKLLLQADGVSTRTICAGGSELDIMPIGHELPVHS